MNARTWKPYAAFGVCHFLLTVFAGVFIPALGTGLADTGVLVAPWWFLAFVILGIVVSLPLVYPLTMLGVIRSWTPSGEVILVLAAIANSVLVAVLLRRFLQRLGSRKQEQRARV